MVNLENKYNLTMKDIRRLKIGDRSKIKEPLFEKNNKLKGWIISENTAEYPIDFIFDGYSEYWLCIFENKDKFVLDVSSFGGKKTYKFNNFFDEKEIFNESQFEIQKKLLRKINELIDMGILIK